MSSRAATNELLAVLSDGDWRPTAWTRFALRAVQRSLAQARSRPRALAEVTVLHAALAAVAEMRPAGSRRRPGWSLTSWALAASHLGMLEHHRSIGWANTITLIRANLPTLGDHPGLGAVAVGSDLVDGRLARHLGVTSPFGAAADALADAAFWTWYAHRHEPARHARTAAALAWVAPVVSVTVLSVKRGRMVDPPRPAMLRPAAALQAVFAARAIVSGARAGRDRGRPQRHRPSVSTVTDRTAGCRLRSDRDG